MDERKRARMRGISSLVCLFVRVCVCVCVCRRKVGRNYLDISRTVFVHKFPNMNAEKRDEIRGTNVIFLTKFRRVTTTFGMCNMYIHVEYMSL